MSRHLITREIGIDAGHRVTHHGSKCRNLHGHRYTIQATCEGPLFTEGEQQGMVLDFGFLKEEMMNEIDSCCDHALILWAYDPLLNILYPGDSQGLRGAVEWALKDGWCFVHPSAADRDDHGYGNLYIVPFVPTAENLARHWFERLTPKVLSRTNRQATLLKVKVWETPNCAAEYPA